ncbi:TRAP transporter substrate-binding protein [Hydrogenophaga sp.]|uniref:TRAP transporter substrate-binding protein n=1 Tax=Hydrogenophaga sp. TaxID=1904254 RepID=UPI00271AC5BB|nr:TRAP transporter substrate-binding protein [Hydrogenophaga sp.]MDO9437046.1 TRAP transporter substrate-binding protein [Hydrogenophaga sp.]
MNAFRFLLCLAWLATVHLPAAQAQTKWDLPAGYAVSSFQTQNLNQFATDVDKATNGKLKIAVHPGASLFKLPEIKRAVMSGQAPIGETVLIAHQNEWQIFGADAQPFLAASYDEAQKLYRAQRPLLERKLAQQGLMLLYTVPWPPQGMFSKKPVASGADLKGMKWRSYSPATSRLGELMGANPVTVQAAELSQALATGVVEAFMTSPTTGVETKVWESVKYYYNLQAWLPKNAVLVNKRAFDALDKATQDALLKSAAAAETRGWAASVAENANALAVLKSRGISIETPSQRLNADMHRMGDVLLKEWSENAGREGAELLQAYRQ